MNRIMNGTNTHTVTTSWMILSWATLSPDAAPSLFAGTAIMYSTRAMSQLTRMIARSGQLDAPGFCARRCQYHAKVMKRLLATSIATVTAMPAGLGISPMDMGLLL